MERIRGRLRSDQALRSSVKQLTFTHGNIKCRAYWFSMSAVNHPFPSYVEDNLKEAIKVIEAHNLGFHPGNAIKYILEGW